jgi:hypothetical protein
LSLLKVVVESRPIAVVKGEEAAKVTEGVNLLKNILVQSKSDSASFERSTFSSPVLPTATALVASSRVIVTIVEAGVGDVETASRTLGILDCWVLLNNVDLIIPVPVIEMVAQSKVGAGGVRAAINRTWAVGEVRREADGVELASSRGNIVVVP